jgi:hypothetical protein
MRVVFVEIPLRHTEDRRRQTDWAAEPHRHAVRLSCGMDQMHGAAVAQAVELLLKHPELLAQGTRQIVATRILVMGRQTRTPQSDIEGDMSGTAPRALSTAMSTRRFDNKGPRQANRFVPCRHHRESVDKIGAPHCVARAP